MEQGYILVQVQEQIPVADACEAENSDPNLNRDIILEPLEPPTSDIDNTENKENSKSEKNWCRIDFYHYSDFLGSDTFGHEKRKVFIGPKTSKDTMDLSRFFEQTADTEEVIGFISPGQSHSTLTLSYLKYIQNSTAKLY